MVSDNGTHFSDKSLQEWLAELHIKQVFSTVAKTQGNDQVEIANRTILDRIHSRLGLKRTRWVDELPKVFWVYRTLKKTSHEENPLSLTYEIEAMIPAEIGLPSARVLLVEEDNEA